MLNGVNATAGTWPARRAIRACAESSIRKTHQCSIRWLRLRGPIWGRASIVKVLCDIFAYPAPAFDEGPSPFIVGSPRLETPSDFVQVRQREIAVHHSLEHADLQMWRVPKSLTPGRGTDTIQNFCGWSYSGSYTTSARPTIRTIPFMPHCRRCVVAIEGNLLLK